MFICYVYTFGHVWPLQQSAFWNVKVNLIVAQREVRQGQIHLSWRRRLMLWQFSNAQLGVWVSSRALQTTNYIFLLLIYVTAFCHLKKGIEYSYIGTDFWKLAGDMVKIWKFTSSPFPFPGLEFKEVWAKINAHMCTEHTVAFIQCYVCIQEKKKKSKKKRPQKSTQPNKNPPVCKGVLIRGILTRRCNRSVEAEIMSAQRWDRQARFHQWSKQLKMLPSIVLWWGETLNLSAAPGV